MNIKYVLIIFASLVTFFYIKRIVSFKLRLNQLEDLVTTFYDVLGGINKLIEPPVGSFRISRPPIESYIKVRTLIQLMPSVSEFINIGYPFASLDRNNDDEHNYNQAIEICNKLLSKRDYLLKEGEAIYSPNKAFQDVFLIPQKILLSWFNLSLSDGKSRFISVTGFLYSVNASRINSLIVRTLEFLAQFFSSSS